MSFLGMERPNLSTTCYRKNHQGCNNKKKTCECSCHNRGRL